MIYTVKKIVKSGTTKTGKSMTMIVLTDGENDYPVTVFDKIVHEGDKIDGIMGEYNSTYKNYKFKVNTIQVTPNSVAKTTQDDLQSNIVFESFFASASTLLQKSEDIGQAVALTWQLHKYLTEDKWVLLCSAEQRKKLVAKYGIDEAKLKAYEKYGKPYLHLLTYREAEALLND